MELRAWQAEALELIRNWDGRPSIVRAVMGAGKSIVIAETVRMYRDRGNVVIAAPTIALVSQLLEDIDDSVAYFTHDKRVGPVTVTTYASLSEVAARLDGCALLICDEAHQTQNKRAADAIAALAPARLLGFTATDWRASRTETLGLFEERIYNYGPDQALADGVVVPYRVIMPEDDDPEDIDGAAVAMSRRAIEHGPTIVNAYSIDDAESFTALLNQAGIPADVVHSQRKDRDAVLRRLFLGELRVVVHVELLREGVNLPWLRCLVIRRIRSRVGFPQEVGRVLRAYAGKSEAIIYDAIDAFGQLGLDYESCLGGDMPENDVPEGLDVPKDVQRAVRYFKRPNKAHHEYGPNVVTLKIKEPGDKLADDWEALVKECDKHQWCVRLHRPRNADLPPAVKADAALRLIRELAITWRAHGGIKRMESRDWRTKLPTEKQLSGLSRMIWTARAMKGVDNKDLWGLVLDQASQGHYDRGTTSDVWSVLRAAEANGWNLWPC